MLAQSDSFVCAARGTDISVEFTRKFGAGFFGGEGFIRQKLQGDELALLHASVTLRAIDLARVTGCA